MQISSEPPPGLEPLAQAEIYNHGYLPVAAAYCRHLGLVELVDRMVATQMRVRPGLVVQAMVLASPTDTARTIIRISSNS